MRTLRGSSLEGTARTEEIPLRELITVPVDVGKSSAMVMACDFTGRVLLPAVEFALTRAGVARMLARVQEAVPAGAQLVRVGVEAAGHYHRPLIMASVAYEVGQGELFERGRAAVGGDLGRGHRPGQVFWHHEPSEAQPGREGLARRSGVDDAVGGQPLQCADEGSAFADT